MYAIEVNNISKQFIISHEGRERYQSLRDIISNRTKKIFSFPSAMKPASLPAREEFWALQDITFNVEQGERIGIVGKNGAGKSTFLKIISRITEPTRGNIRIRGRVASLLEVGTGFHWELTGRENIFLNGAILGMSRREIRKKFDEIVAFAEVEKFLDTPVKRYSTGMYVRLAFAVAAHLEPEILVVDEVLAVGDAQFQKKCLGKMEEVSRNEGRTVLFVSHNMGVVQELCQRAILLKAGRLDAIDTAANIVTRYISGINEFQSEFILPADKPVVKNNYVTRVSLSNVSGEKKTDYSFGESLKLDFEFVVKDPTNTLYVYIGLNDKFQSRVFTLAHPVHLFRNADGHYYGSVVLPPSVIAPNNYSFVFGLREKWGPVQDMLENICPFHIHDPVSEQVARFENEESGSIIVNPIWNID